MAQLLLVDAAVFAFILETPLVALDVLRVPLAMLFAALLYRKGVKKPAKYGHTVTVLPAKLLDELADVSILGDAAPTTVEPLG